MTQFEYLSIATSIVMALGVARLLNGLSVIARSHNGYWVHTLWIIHLGLTHLLFWWTFWSFREAQWSVLNFVMSFTVLCALYFQATSLVPDDPLSVKNWRDFYAEERKPYFLAMSAYVLALFLSSMLVKKTSLLDVERIPQAMMFTVAVLGYRFDNESAQRWLAIVSIVFITVGLFAIPPNI